MCVDFGRLNAKLSRNPQVDDQSLQCDTGTLKFAQRVHGEGDKFHPSALKQSFTAVNPGSVEKPAGKTAPLALWHCYPLADWLKWFQLTVCIFLHSPQSLFVSSSQKKNFAYHAEVAPDQNHEQQK